MKMRITLLITAIAFTLSSFAQHKEMDKDKREQVEAQKIAYLSKRMELSPDEAKIFWPVHDKYDAQLHELRKEYRASMKAKGNDLNELSDSEIEVLIDKEMEIKEQELKVRQSMHTELKKLIGPKSGHAVPSRKRIPPRIAAALKERPSKTLTLE